MATRNPEVEALKAVLERVRAAKGADHALGCEVIATLLDTGPANDPLTLRIGRVLMAEIDVDPCVTTSIDAALALVERVLPGWDFHFYPEDGGYVAEMDWPKDARVGDAGYFGITGRGATRALAILSGALEGQIALTQGASDVEG